MPVHLSPPLLIPSARTTLTSLSIPFGRSHNYRYAKGTPEGNAFSVPVAYGYARTAPKGLPRLVKVVRAEGISSGGIACLLPIYKRYKFVWGQISWCDAVARDGLV